MPRDVVVVWPEGSYWMMTSKAEVSGAEAVAPWSFEDFHADVESRLRRALVAAYGVEDGMEATTDALAWAWEHQARLPGLNQPVAYLFRVGQSRRRRRRVPIFRPRLEWSEPWVEPALAGALSRLSQRQRVAVVLVHGYEWTLVEVAEVLGVGPTTVQTHLRRGIERLQRALEVEDDN
jgi:RNA polymerase sigma factor (sigma-70 family)